MASARVSVGSNSGSDSEIQDDYLGGSDSEGGDGEGETQDQAGPVSGITDVMSKILNNVVPSNKAPILAKGQTDRQIRKKKKRKEKDDDGAEGKPVHKREKRSKEGGGSSSDWSDESDEDAGRKSYLQMQKRREWNNIGRVKPHILSKEKERRLQKIATKGVVQIFNVVLQQQSIVGEKLSKAGSSVRRRDKVMGAISKKQFLDLLDHSQTKSAPQDSGSVTQDDSEQRQSGAKWSILRDDFMMKASMKDWDRDDDDDDDDR